MLLEFLGGIVSPQDLEGWLISYLDDEVADSERDALWEMRLLLVEYGEGIRPVDDARACARRLLSENAV
jgi:hypothetical protein